MYDLSSIINRNRAAACAGVPVKGVGAEGIKPKPVNVIRLSDGVIIETCDSAFIACSKYRQEQKAGLVSVEDAE
ncbi:MAG: hypothetical protein RBS78_00830 [Coriobacteriia bacterium]|jgi:hypothetical protein|nr:hypothetical protein [Coriobacteriia bacterium]